ncbi:MAG: hypothetical protein IJK37_10745 [Prevotella sp.]|jgi:hypothetical protein|uniref:Lipoprotein n=1 Tax=Xylanibacter ruminicola TaxID=839 RepID=A0A1M7CAZ7_XYLRU|nr:hypothetical protein [Xylanibacter ruminicola]MBQ6917027.1 hypothetical protein [Prevotella sp.]MBR0390564.1 hypothetical protein [Prevotella sp.]SFB88366.1 hypothetical protein SAMN04488493_10228 [Xylanibacter ruminicola]SHL64381.1 hypothetical protein SAMN04488494_0367 [Xylanibacter ruminicola]
MKGLIGGIFAVMLMAACGGRSMSAEEMQHKLDSIQKIEAAERLAAQGINLADADNPLKQFYDSLNLLPLPITYSDELVRYLPDFKPVPQDIAKALELEGNNKQKAISLSESLGARLMILAADEEDDRYSLWLYSLDNDYMPVDKLCLYAIDEEADLDDFGAEDILQYFTITSDYEIHLMDYSKEAHKTRTEEVFTLDAQRNFQLQKSEELD